MNAPDTNHFSFSLAGETGRFYRIWATTNLVDWMDEESLAPGGMFFPAVVMNTNPTCVYSIPMVTDQKFLRATHHMNTEICIAQLQAIRHAIRFWAIEARRSESSTVTELDVEPYLHGTFSCPSGGTVFADSYCLTDVASRPCCLKAPLLHKLPP